MGFGIPLKSWLSGPMYALVKDVLLDRVSMEPLNHEQVVRYLREFEQGAYSVEPIRIWVLLMYGLWRRHCALA